MRILHVTPTYRPNIGGIESVVANLAREQRQNGHVADIAHLAPIHASLRREVEEEGLVWRVPLWPHRLVGLAPALSQIAGDYDLLHVHDPQLMSITASVILFGRSRPAVLSTHGGYRHTRVYSAIKSLHWALVARSVIRRYARVLASSKSDQHSFARIAPHAVLAENGIDIARFAFRPRTQGDLRRWVYWGRLSRNKQVDLLIDYVGALRERGHDIHLTICGKDFDGVAEAIIRSIHERGLAGNVALLDEIEEGPLAELVARSGAFITASEYEGFGLTVLEAMSAGLPVFCRDIEPLNGFVEDGVNVVLLTWGRGTTDFARIETMLMIGSEEVGTLSKQCRSTAAEFDWKTRNRIFEQNYYLALGIPLARSRDVNLKQG